MDNFTRTLYLITLSSFNLKIEVIDINYMQNNIARFTLFSEIISSSTGRMVAFMISLAAKRSPRRPLLVKRSLFKNSFFGFRRLVFNIFNAHFPDCFSSMLDVVAVLHIIHFNLW